MRKLFAVLAISVFAGACGDELVQPVAPEADGPQFAKWGAFHGAWAYRDETDACKLWDATDEPIWTPCGGQYTPGATFGWRLWSDGIYNPYGKAVHFGPDHWPYWIPVGPFYTRYGIHTVDGLLPLCDWDPLHDPGYTQLLCTFNWHYTISASGQGLLVATFDPAHTIPWPPES